MKGLLLGVLLFGVLFAWVGGRLRQARRQVAATEAIERMGGDVTFDYEYDARGDFLVNAKPPGPAWLNKRFRGALFSSVRCVWLRNRDIKDSDLRRLAEFPHLEELDLENTPVTNCGLTHLEGLTEITMLDLSNTRVTDAGLVHLRELRQIRHLYLDDLALTSAATEHLKGLKNLDCLCIRRNNIDDSGLANLAALQALNSLDLSGTRVSDSGAQELAALRNLENLGLHDTAVTRAGIRKLNVLLPGCQIHCMNPRQGPANPNSRHSTRRRGNASRPPPDA